MLISMLPPQTAASAPLSLDDLEQMALANNPTLEQAARSIQALQGKYLQEGLYPNPVVGYAGEEIGDDGRAGKQGMVVGQSLVTAGKLRLNRAVVGHEIARARQMWELQRRRVTNDVRVVAFATMAAQRRITLADQLVRIGEEGRNVAEQLLAAKEVSRVDVLQARIEANTARLLFDNAQTEYQAAWRKLATVMGLPEMPPAELHDALTEAPPAMDWVEARTRLLGSSPELAGAYDEVERAKCELARAYAGRVPDLDIEAGVLHDFASEYTLANVGVAVPLQLFDRNQGNIHRAQAELASARQEVRRVELDLQQRLAAAFDEYSRARQRVAHYGEEILPDAKDSLGLVQEGYRHGEFGYLELLTTQRTYFQANLAYVNALRDLWINHTRIEGLLLQGGLESPQR